MTLPPCMAGRGMMRSAPASACLSSGTSYIQHALALHEACHKQGHRRELAPMWAACLSRPVPAVGCLLSQACLVMPVLHQKQAAAESLCRSLSSVEAGPHQACPSSAYTRHIRASLQASRLHTMGCYTIAALWLLCPQSWGMLEGARPARRTGRRRPVSACLSS